jgi:hypothetical protein
VCNVLIIEIDWLLVCNKAFIDCTYCWCAIRELLNVVFAGVHMGSY